MHVISFVLCWREINNQIVSIIHSELGQFLSAGKTVKNLLTESFICKNNMTRVLCGTIMGGRRVIRQTEIARKMVGKTGINQKPAAAEIEVLPI